MTKMQILLCKISDLYEFYIWVLVWTLNYAVIYKFIEIYLFSLTMRLC